MADLYVDEGELQSLSSTLSQRVDHMEAIIDNVPMTSAYLANNWEGEAARAAFNRMRMTEEALRETAEALSRARQLLDEAIRTYEETEQTVSSLWSL
ncbi:WXG100 family type VII secretion target [Schaalia odontolytica]|mgnify:FL=1|uniref:ESAT-6-like protein n=1 Tax=Schaalia odontolytica TaxID=1660 RepID=A0A2X0VQV7_9ACTO|nr:WXG100 family type VII secretion target [Schaalia odontolytica]WMS28128.1 WXG100 family type VII secretion target [Schaalia odontolytica]SPT56071.1 WXG100 family type VII secretion target [Schaalia odontolytica]